MAFCVNCGKQLVEGASFCAFCGSKVGVVSVQTAPVPPVQPNTQRQQESVGKIFKCPNCGEVLEFEVEYDDDCDCDDCDCDDCK